MSTASTIADFTVTGMTCGHCELSVREEVEALPGVASVAVSAQTGKLSVETDGTVTDAAITAAVTEAGYAAARA
ncbi:heavy-metal-associated domain-containing protein [Leucobacter luti]|uniref:Copper chaperone CopZ n=1 Tax=Leucobacter luti TaxID=340320 RepID=A0A4V6MD60_9MICO|nr:heavy metal-associated domain-containing protein [Leucobacter luti]MBL3699429.1 heavy-metal-associated domain-containing protein [Leucobacter luti]RZT66939.1 copper chaperone CopZ [Leucobacter luti]